MQFDPILRGHHPHRQLEQLEDDGQRLGLRQFGMDQDFGAQRLMQDISRAGEKQAQVVGEEAVVGGPIACLLYTSRCV